MLGGSPLPHPLRSSCASPSGLFCLLSPPFPYTPFPSGPPSFFPLPLPSSLLASLSARLQLGDNLPHLASRLLPRLIAQLVPGARPSFFPTPIPRPVPKLPHPLLASPTYPPGTSCTPAVSMGGSPSVVDQDLCWMRAEGEGPSGTQLGVGVGHRRDTGVRGLQGQASSALQLSPFLVQFSTHSHPLEGERGFLMAVEGPLGREIRVASVQPDKADSMGMGGRRVSEVTGQEGSAREPEKVQVLLGQEASKAELKTSVIQLGGSKGASKVLIAPELSGLPLPPPLQIPPPPLSAFVPSHLGWTPAPFPGWPTHK